MSLQHAAKHLAAHGRGPDTMLVHMTPGEVKSLNDIAMAHGGHLTTNPHTGLPEAGFLSSLLPMVAGIGLTAISGGLINPMTAGLLVGGGTGLMTGDLKKGLIAGLGAYGGAGIGSALGASGVQAAALEPAASTASTAATPSVMAQVPAAPSVTPLSDLASITPGSTAPMSPTQMFSQIPSTTPVTAQTMGFNPVTPTPSVIGSGYSDALANQQAAFDTGTAGERLSTMGKGAQDLTRSGGFDRFYENLTNDPNTFGPKTTLAAAAAPTAYSLYEDSKPKPPAPTPVDSDPGQQYDFMANPTNPTPSSSPYGAEQKYFAPQYVKRTTPRFADGGMSHLGDYSDGGRLLRGPGDGVSDSIPAVIGKKQPARLADGEFVVPARIVSELGNGSTEAGARKLYAMMDRIQKARSSTVGKGKVAKNSRAEKYLPA